MREKIDTISSFFLLVSDFLIFERVSSSRRSSTNSGSRSCRDRGGGTGGSGSGSSFTALLLFQDNLCAFIHFSGACKDASVVLDHLIPIFSDVLIALLKKLGHFSTTLTGCPCSHSHKIKLVRGDIMVV
ncbi:ORF169 [White spot syndrome virus]|uniref:ORF169 n=1 Tax=White spot syndrome virus TaxID=342409 RepID=A0A2D3I583_9VIRU|nr:ORF169 [White spot syndrome virus]